MSDKMRGPELVARVLAVEGIISVLLDRMVEGMNKADALALLDDIDNKAKTIAGNVDHEEMNDAADRFVDEFIGRIKKKQAL